MPKAFKFEPPHVGSYNEIPLERMAPGRLDGLQNFL